MSLPILVDGVPSTQHPLYNIYLDMKRRCYSEYREVYKYYGAKGIKVCDRWLNSFASFVQDVGARPSLQHTLNRKDNLGDYTPENVCWADKLEQMNNMSSNKLITYLDKTQTLAQWARESNQDHEKLRRRLIRGWTMQEALDPTFRRVNKIRCPPDSEWARRSLVNANT